MKSKLVGIIFVFGSLYYLVAELISSLFFNDSFVNVYLFHTISELGIPNSLSPLFRIMNSAFIVIGLTLLFGNFYYFKNFILKNKMGFQVLTVITSIGVVIVALIHGGNPLTSGYHTLGAVMSILGGNILLILISKSMGNFGLYQKITLFLGVFGVVVFWVMFFNMENMFMPIFERLSVYSLILWSFITGIYLIDIKD